MGRHTFCHGTRRGHGRVGFEVLEDRMVLSTILWTNRNDGVNVFNFNAAFGTQANAAMQVIDGALLAWERVIENFNWPDNPEDNTFEVEITVDPNNSGCGGGADTGDDDDGVPQNGTFTFGACGGPANIGWFLDPTPLTAEEFRGEIINAFSLNATPGGPAVNMNDLFTVVVAEMTHLLGISGDEDFLFEDLNDNDPPFVDTGADDAAFDVGTLWTYNFGLPFNVKALFTDNNSGNSANGGTDTDEPLHIAEPVSGNQISSGGATFYGAQDLTNAVYEGGRRYLPSQLIAQVMNEIYPYDMVGPDEFGTAYANFDPTTGELLLRGGSAGEGIYFPTTPSNDSFTLKREGGLLSVFIDIGTDVPGTAVDAGMVSRFDFSAIQSISIQTNSDPNVVIDGAGDDTVILDFGDGDIIPPGGISIDGGSDSNSLIIKGSNIPQNYQIDPTQITVGSGSISYANFESIEIDAPSATSNNSFRVDGTPSDLLNLFLFGSNGDDIFDIEAHDAATTTLIVTGNGFDQAFLSFVQSDMDDIEGVIQVSGGTDSNDDLLRMWDTSDNSNNKYLVTTGSSGQGVVQRGSDLTVEYDLLENFEIRGGSGNDTFDIRDTQAGTPLELFGSFGGDTFTVDSNGSAPGGTANLIDSRVTVDGSVGTNVLVLNDTSDSTANKVTVTAEHAGAFASDNFFGTGGSVFYSDIALMLINMGFGGNTIEVHDTAAGTTTAINSGRGSDNFRLFSPDMFEPDFGNAGGIVSHVLVNGQEGFNTVWVSDSTDTTADQVTVTENQVGAELGDNYFGPGGKVTYTAVNDLRLDGGNAGDSPSGNTFFIKSTFPDTTTTINSGKNDDTVLVDSNSNVFGGNVDGIRSSLTVNGQEGKDAVTIEDSQAVAGKLVTVTATQVGSEPGDSFFPAGGFFTYGELEMLTVNMGPGGDAIGVRSTAPGTETLVNGGFSSDVILVDSNGPAAAGTLNLIRSRVFVDGQSGNDTLILTDSSEAVPTVATISPTDVGAAMGDNLLGSGGSVGYADVSLLELLTGTSQDFVNVTGTASGTPLEITTGDGADSLKVFAPIASMITYTAGNPAAAPGDSLEVVGTIGSEGRYFPSATTPGNGTVFLDGQGIVFTGLEPITASGFDKFTVVTPNSLDMLAVQPFGAGLHELTGTSGGVAIEPLVFHDIQRLTLDTGTNDGAMPNDVVTVSATDLAATGVDVLSVSAGNGANDIAVQSGRVNLDVASSAVGQENVQVANAGTTVNFVASQQLTSLTMGPGSFVNLTSGGDKVLVTEVLSIAGGAVPVGTLDLVDNAAVVNYADPGPSPFALHEAQVIHARDQNLPVLWTGTGITSAQAALDPAKFGVVLFEATDLFGPGGGSFLGVPIAAGDEAVLIRAASSVEGDMDQDGDLDFDDISAFVLGLNNPDAYIAMYGVPPANNGDLDGDGDADFDDISDFVDQLTASLLAGGATSSVASSSTVVDNRPSATAVDFVPLAADAVMDDAAGSSSQSVGASASGGRRLGVSEWVDRHRARRSAARPVGPDLWTIPSRTAVRRAAGEADLAAIWSPARNWLGGSKG